ncbi:hypothetical protein [Cystobacter ferrugineus]|uniref:Uncharacterized protein n=1 Tax=Cystobacter ferrugineus TaxID=83449 RepID=A0A1L9B221_9BACT|nr:hypothetical protein [Cystobacter ferrugineus]OJH36308.1 hypothetical protein BON30_34740 [Cystobacter ferrugineus]
MSLLALALALSLAQTPCRGERVVLVPFQPVALSTAEARRAEDLVRRTVEALPGACLESRADTVARMRARGGRLSGCSDAACRGAQVLALGAERLVRGVALGVGGTRSVALTLVDREGHESHATLELSPSEAVSGQDETRAREALTSLWTARTGRRVDERPARVLPTVLVSAGGVALAVGVGFGLAARQSQKTLSTGSANCGGEGQAFRECFTARLREGRSRATTANVLLGAGALLGAGGTVLFIWELP